jgi:hypothetical protein
MQNHFINNVQGADITDLLRAFARRFFSEQEKLELRKNHTRLVEVLAELAALADDGARGIEVFKAEAERLTQDETLTLSERMSQLEELRAQQSKRPDREAALHALELRYHQFFVGPADRLSQAFTVPLAEQVALAEATEIYVAKKFGIPLERIEGALGAPMRRAYEATKEAKHAPGGAASWLERAGIFLPDDDLATDDPDHDLARVLQLAGTKPAEDVPTEIKLGTPPRLTAPQGMRVRS